MQAHKFGSAIVILSSLCCSAISATASERNLRTQSDGWGETEISFCSRPSPNTFGFPGHAFVGFSEKPAGNPRVYRAVGHTITPSAGLAPTVFTYFGGASIAGQQAEERYTHLKQTCLTVLVDRSIYQKALAAAKPTLSSLGIPDNVAASLERYSLNENDCIDFTIKVAQQVKSAGLSVPSRKPTDTPTAYIVKLINANP